MKLGEIGKSRREKNVARWYQIQIINLVDVTFLLIIFLVSSSTFYKSEGSSSASLSIKLPKSKYVDKVKSEYVSVYIYKDRQIKIEQKFVSYQNFSKELQTILKSANTNSVVINSDRDVDLGFVVSIIGKAKAIGASEISIASVPDLAND